MKNPVAATIHIVFDTEDDGRAICDVSVHSIHGTANSINNGAFYGPTPHAALKQALKMVKNILAPRSLNSGGLRVDVGLESSRGQEVSFTGYSRQPVTVPGSVTKTSGPAGGLRPKKPRKRK